MYKVSRQCARLDPFPAVSRMEPIEHAMALSVEIPGPLGVFAALTVEFSQFVLIIHPTLDAAGQSAQRLDMNLALWAKCLQL